ncbi:MAG TPA: MauE/DoxX family redox-associated membrane protein [Acidimicrobiales bacterium]|nr:MauE/DoxX family redox-associated membrane protein [Acidimicrobiales bacterium]
MAAAAAITISAAWLAILAGVAKLLRPSEAVEAMRAVRLPAGAALVRAGALVECGLGVAVLASPSWIARVLLAGSYVALGAFVVVSMRTSPDVGCGCFGGRGPTSHVRHLAITGACALGAAASALHRGAAPMATVHWTSPRGAVALVLGAASAVLAATYAGRERVA